MQFIVYERKAPSGHQTPTSIHEIDLSSVHHASALSPTAAQPLYRKRIIYAHSAILKARSSYFDDMLNGTWTESKPNDAGGAHVIKILDFDFVAVYWMLSWLYTNESE